MKKWLKKTQRTALGIGALALFINFSCHADTALDKLNKTGEISIGYSNEEPFAYADASGKVTGESPEIARIIFKKLGAKKVDSVLTEWGALIPGLHAGRFDVIAAGMYITPERCKQVLFTDPQYQLGDTLLVKPGNPKKLHSYADFAKNHDLRLAVTAGTVELKYARDSGIADDQIIQVPNTTAQLQAVKAGRADAAIGTALTMKDLAKKGGSSVEATTDFVDDPSHIGYGALAFRPQDKELRDKVNAELKKWLGSEEHLRTVAPFGFDKSNITHKTAAEICKGS
ncbi:ectoine/hydroxyectoine ABC transporter substrate-binding protein EhuB [Klebsiella quasipneumoniae]|jgi:polar amino acid transport system substrate-binding protein|uniref:Arginine ABC transporter n=2 Tax=Klebsiella pneumoniae complex TaxID=3390273 RepID=A0ABD7PE80_KLEVA|nr:MULTISPECIES: ectoine/hydroxyectoine ABC transporter substrate-binding protein EhuB [Klebsiella/Raoultella group]EKH6437500.1 ectoine/hydroxyectoine ABC transporter substrate-binding protein EhuB [Klebsiella oxytoca]MDU3075479.1 ectoine/hydroxyectoine ABC transporter substrate-binding protein EhuB [Mixta calida]MVX97400.1 ectoine/hydroxyectoine ABC transporter substrate-binding protein EhuB [Enterobacteriaceae bacterium 8376wB9]MVY11335.1 ectoine/hydroxyectoine ABC transporter substrate-bind